MNAHRTRPSHGHHVISGALCMLLMIGGLVPPHPLQQPPLILTESRPTADKAFGSALAVGDFNSDGAMDLAVANAAEQVFIFYGKATPSRTPDATLSTREKDIAFGYTLASGEWNGDGRTDLAIGAPNANNSEDSSSDGWIFVYRGASRFGTSPATLRSPIPPDDLGTGGHLGFALTSGDVNGDGTDDLIASADLAAAVVVFYGGRTIGSRRTILQGDPESFFAFAIAAGDVNGDGMADIIVGAPAGGPHGNGAAFVYYGRPSLSGRPDLTLPNPHLPASEDDLAFATVFCVADLNRDGTKDIIIGSPNTSDDPRPGRVYVYYGGSTLSTTPDLIIEEPSPQVGSGFGFSLTSADLNGDGTNDLVVGAPMTSLGTRKAGRVYIFYGGRTINPNADRILDPPNPESGQEFGMTLAVGDLNRDRKPDLIVGAPGTARRAGQVFLYLGQ